MVKRRLQLILVLAAAIAVIVAVYIWLHVLTPHSASPVQISVDASKLPASCEVLGAKVTLQPTEWKGNYARFKWSIDSRSALIEEDGNRFFFNGMLNRSLYSTTSDLSKSHILEMCTDIQPPRETQYFDLVQDFHIKAKSKNARFRFANLDPNRLPEKKHIGSATVTIRNIGIEKLTGNSWRMSRPPLNQVPRNKQFAILHADISVPGVYEFEAKVTNTATSWGYSWKEHDHDILFESNPTMRSDSKPVVRAIAYKSEIVSDESDAFSRETHVRTTPEQVVEVVSPQLASKMVTHRAMNAVNAAKPNTHMLVWLAFPTDGAIPKHMNFEMSVQLPPDASEKAVVVFRNAPIR